MAHCDDFHFLRHTNTPAYLLPVIDPVLQDTFLFVQTLKDEDTKKDYDYMLDHPGLIFCTRSHP